MVKKFFSNEFLQFTDFELTQDQKKALDSFSDFFLTPETSVFILNGYAGTGKTTLIKLIVSNLQRYGFHYILLAPTGRAAKVLSSYCNELAFTIHKHIYRQKSLLDFRFIINYDVPKNTIFIIDEASLISNESTENNVFGSGKLLNDLLEYVFKYSSNKIVFVGDSAQLPPVGSTFHPALSKDTFSSTYSVFFAELKTVVRQQASSSILKNATVLRECIINNEVRLPSFDYSNNDFVLLNSSEIMDAISTSYNEHGTEETIILTYSNKRALAMNRAIRNQIFHFDEEVTNGECLMVVKNNYMPLPQDCSFNFIANGEMIRLKKIKKYQELYDFRFLHATIQLMSIPDYDLDTLLLLDTLHTDLPSLSKDAQEKLFQNVMNDYIDISNKRKRIQKVKENRFFNALQVKYAYAVTTHKAQGGQWKHVYIDASFLHYSELSIDILKWFYTSITRATEKVYLLGLPEKYR